jgi:hypothetical protein
MEILKSASKIVFVLLAFTACVAFYFQILSENNFMLLATASFSFYFSNKGNKENNYLNK